MADFIEKRFEFTRNFKYIALALAGIGVIAIVVAFIIDPERAWANILLNNYYFLCLAIGASFFLALQYITQSGWSAAFKRIPEALASFIPWLALFMLLMLIGMNSLYPWIQPEKEGFDDHALHLIHHKDPYLNVPFFIIRLVIFFGVWIVMTRLLRKYSLKEDLEGGVAWFEKSEFYSKIYIFTLALTFSLASFDWIMSLEPTWFSTIFALKNFVTAFYHGTSLIVLIIVIMHYYGYFPFISNAHWHDFSKYVFILSILWGYFWFSQYLLIWYANIPEETIYYFKRTQGTWEILFYVNLAINWALPFLALLSNYFARKKTVLGIITILILIGLYTDLFEQVMPGTVGDFRFGLIEIGMFAGYAGFFLYIFGKNLSSAGLIPRNHPYLEESLRHTGEGGEKNIKLEEVT